jgi:hypothetical protein
MSSPDVAPVDISEMSRLVNGEHPTNNNNSRDELTGINVYRASEDSELILIEELTGTPETFTDTDVQNGIEYSYAVTSVYDNGVFESEFSNIATAMPMSTITLGLSDGNVQSGDILHLTLSMDNSDPVAGLQFDLTALPDYLTLVGADPTARIPEDWSISTNADGRVLGFSFSGTTIDAGEGDIFDLSFTSFAPEPASIVVPENENPKTLPSALVDIDQSSGILAVGSAPTKVR